MKSRNRDRESQPIFLPIIFGVAALSAGAFGLSKGAEGAWAFSGDPQPGRR